MLEGSDRITQIQVLFERFLFLNYKARTSFVCFTFCTKNFVTASYIFRDYYCYSAAHRTAVAPKTKCTETLLPALQFSSHAHQ